MQIELASRPSFGMAVVDLEEGEEIIAEAGAMVAMQGGLRSDTRFAGTGSGLFGSLQAVLLGLARKFLAGESMFLNHFRARSRGQLMLAPSMVGDIVHLGLDQAALMVQGRSYLASTPGVSVDVVWGGLSMLFSGEGAFFLRCHGTGDLLINAYGAIDRIEVDGSYIIDSGHLVAYQGDLRHSVRRAGGWKSTLLSGEGMVLELAGKGTVWVQTRNVSSLVSWITPHLP